MSYFLGIDLGTTYTAAAVWRDGRAEIANLGGEALVVPSVVLVGEDGGVLTGEAAARRALLEPQRVARELKRRIGDPTPIFVGGRPYGADKLTSRLLRAVVARVAQDQHCWPTGVGLSHPATWGAYKKDVLRQAADLAGLGDAVLLTEPEAAAVHYASQNPVEPGTVVAVYNLGGGMFDAAVLRRTGQGWEILGHPEGIERLGGADFDQAVFQHVVAAIGDPFHALDPDDPGSWAAVARLRQECVAAKEALASDTDVTIPVVLPTIHTDVRLTRGEFEDMIRPALDQSITGLHRALHSAGVHADDVSAVLLVGGSSRIPLVAQLVGSAFVRPVAVDAHPKHSVSLGAAVIAADHASPGVATTSEVLPVEDATPAAVTFWTAPMVSHGSLPPAPAPAPPPVRKTASVFSVSASGGVPAVASIPNWGPPEAQALAPAPASRSTGSFAGPPSGAHGLPPVPPTHTATGERLWPATLGNAATVGGQVRSGPPATGPVGLGDHRRPSPFRRGSADTDPAARRHLAAQRRADLRELEERRRWAVRLVAGGVTTLVVAFVAVLALGRANEPGTRVPGVPGGAPVNVSPEGPATTRPGSSSSSSTTTVEAPGLVVPEAETSVPDGSRATTSSTRPTTTSESPTTTASTTTTEATTTTSEPTETTTTTDHPGGAVTVPP